MKRILVLCLFALLLGLGFVYLLEHDAGYVLISWSYYRFESSFWVALGCLIGLGFMAWFLVSIFLQFIRRSRALRYWFTNKGYRRSQQKTTEGIIAYVEGNWAHSRRMLSYAASKSETPLINYLFAARASHELGDDARTKQLLSQAEQSTDGAGIAVELAQAEMQYQAGQLEQCLATLTRLRRNATRHPYVLKLLKSVYLELGDWSNLAELLPELKKTKIVSDQELEQLALKSAAAQLQESRGEGAAILMQGVWQRQPKELTRNSELVAAYARCLLAIDESVAAEKLLRSQLKREWQPELVALYGRAAGEDGNKQLLQAEHWLQERNGDAPLLLCLGRLALRCELWGKAREYFEDSLKLSPSAECCAELGRLLASLGEHKLSAEFFQRGLLLSTHGLPALPQPS